MEGKKTRDAIDTLIGRKKKLTGTHIEGDFLLLQSALEKGRGFISRGEGGWNQ